MWIIVSLHSPHCGHCEMVRVTVAGRTPLRGLILEVGKSARCLHVAGILWFPLSIMQSLQEVWYRKLFLRKYESKSHHSPHCSCHEMVRVTVSGRTPWKGLVPEVGKCTRYLHIGILWIPLCLDWEPVLGTSNSNAMQLLSSDIPPCLGTPSGRS